jgi:hypothetical protein
LPAPINGIVLTRTANLGLVTNMSQELFTVADFIDSMGDGKYQREGFLDRSCRHRRRNDNSGLPRPCLERTSRLHPTSGGLQHTDSAGSNRGAELDESLRLDMYMDVSFMSASGKGLTVPESAVQAIGEKQYVFLPVTDSDGSFAVRQVKLGPASNGFYPVLDGLTLNDEVVNEGSFILKRPKRYVSIPSCKEGEIMNERCEIRHEDPSSPPSFAFARRFSTKNHLCWRASVYGDRCSCSRYAGRGAEG